MSDKRRFVQALFIHCRPAREKFGAALEYAEAAWHFLTEQGYGGPRKDEPKPRGRVDWYARLDAARRERFDAFWRAYDHKKGRNDAALVFGQLVLEEAEWDWLVASAKREAQLWRDSPPQGQTRIYAQGWLSGYRWRDHPPPGETAAVGVNGLVQKSQRFNALRQFRELYQRAPNAALAAKIEQLEAELNGG